jgi:hypothetical protein
LTAGTRVDVDGGVAAGCEVAGGVAAGVGTVVATVVGAEHAANANDARNKTRVGDATEDDNFMRELTGKGIL